MTRFSSRLIWIVLVVAVIGALTWLANDITAPGPAGAEPTATAIAVLPTAVPVVAATAAPTAEPSAAPTAVPTAAATETPQPTATTAPPTPTDVPQPTALPASATPTEARPTPTTASAAPGAQYTGYTVRDGDTLDAIAGRFGTTPERIASYNLLSGEPHAGRALIIPLPDNAQAPAGEPLLVRRGRGGAPVVALTLDAGGSAESAEAVLKTLRDHNTRITFFLTGKWIRENPDLTRQIVADGHEIANHTTTHRDLTKLDDATIRQELASTEAALHEVVGAPVNIRPFFRPPYGAYDDRVLQVVESEGYMPIYWTLDSLDSVGEPKTAAFLVERVTTKLPPEKLQGAIILAHCGFSWTAEALPTILDRFAEMGYEVKKLSEVL